MNTDSNLLLYEKKPDWYDFIRMSLLLICILLVIVYNLSIRSNAFIVCFFCFIFFLYYFYRQLVAISFNEEGVVVNYLVEKSRSYRASYDQISLIQYVSFALRGGKSIRIYIKGKKMIEVSYTVDKLLDILKDKGVKVEVL